MFVVAHRTTTPARAAADVAAGASYLEVDVRLVGADIVVSHYRPVARTAGWLERDNARLRVGGGRPRDVRLGVLLPTLPRTAGVLIDPKDREEDVQVRLAGVLAGLATAGELDPARCVVSTGCLPALAALRACGLRTWRTLDTPADLQRAAAGAPLPDEGVSVRHSMLTAARLAALHAVTDTVVAWTVNRAARAAELASWGVNGVTTDRVTLVSAAVKR